VGNSRRFALQQGETSAACNYISFYFYYALITYFLLMQRSIKEINGEQKIRVLQAGPGEKIEKRAWVGN